MSCVSPYGRWIKVRRYKLQFRLPQFLVNCIMQLVHRLLKTMPGTFTQPESPCHLNQVKCYLSHVRWNRNFYNWSRNPCFSFFFRVWLSWQACSSFLCYYPENVAVFCRAYFSIISSKYRDPSSCGLLLCTVSVLVAGWQGFLTIVTRGKSHTKPRNKKRVGKPQLISHAWPDYCLILNNTWDKNTIYGFILMIFLKLKNWQKM